MIKVFIGKEETFARPFEFDSDIVDDQFRNAFKQPVRPTKAVTTCSKCGNGFDFPISNYNGGPLTVTCPYCKPVVVPPDPFCDPIKLGLITTADLNPSAIARPRTLDTVRTSVGDRLAAAFDDKSDQQESNSGQESESLIQMESSLVAQPKTPKAPKTPKTPKTPKAAKAPKEPKADVPKTNLPKPKDAKPKDRPADSLLNDPEEDYEIAGLLGRGNHELDLGIDAEEEDFEDLSSQSFNDEDLVE